MYNQPFFVQIIHQSGRMNKDRKEKQSDKILLSKFGLSVIKLSNLWFFLNINDIDKEKVFCEILIIYF